MTDIRMPDWLIENTTRQVGPVPGDHCEVDDDPRPKYIYALLDPETDEPRYIGKSIRPFERLRDHINEPPSNCHRSHWLQSLKRCGLEPTIVVLECVTGLWPWQNSERYWIAYGRANGWRLVNNTDGGDGVAGLPQETRERMRSVWLGRKHKPETIAKLCVARRLRKTSDATRAKMSAAHSGRKITWIDKVAAALRKLTPEQERSIRERLARGERVVDLAREFGMHRTSISKVKKGTYRGQHHH